MAYKNGNREQITLLPDSVDDYVHDEDPVRAYDAFIDCLDLDKLGISIDSNLVGNSSYHPKTMLKILVYAYSYGWRSSRKIERALHHNLSFIWLAGGLKPAFKTIANFRKNNKETLKQVFVHCARLAMKLNLIEGNTLFTDGSKFRANAGNRESRSIETWTNYKKHVEVNIVRLLEESSSIDEADTGSLVKIGKELKSSQKLANKISSLLKEFEKQDDSSVRFSNGGKRINGTDPDCKILKSRQGSHAAYNVQSTTDLQFGLIVALEGSSSRNDMNELATQVAIAEKNMDKDCETICADSGYSSINDLAELDLQGKNVIVPTTKQVEKDKIANPFSKDNFQYQSKSDTYICPEGKELYRSSNKPNKDGRLDYRIKDKTNCLTCMHFGTCTTSNQGRRINMSVHQKTKKKLEDVYSGNWGQSVYNQRKNIAELPFGHFKRNLGMNAFLLRGMKGINAELGIVGTCFNLARMITLLGGVRPLIAKFQEIR
ncbi:MAG: transposase [Flavobacteriales bacterium]|jgi:transposase